MRRRYVTLAGLVGLLAGCLVAVALAAGGSGRSASHRIAASRRAAQVAAGRLLAEVVLPSDARRLKQEPRGRHYELGRPWEGASFAAEVDRHAFWKTSASPSTVVAAFESHRPAGAKPLQSLSDGGWDAASYTWDASGRFEIGPQLLMVSAVALPDGATGIRADAVVRYLSPRSGVERVPGTARLVQITTANFGEKPIVLRVVRRRSLVRALARDVDSLPFAGRLTGSAGCPANNRVPTITFVFRDSSRDRALARVSELADTPVYPFSPCRLTFLTINGKKLPPLLDGGILLNRAGQLLGVKLTD